MRVPTGDRVRARADAEARSHLQVHRRYAADRGCGGRNQPAAPPDGSLSGRRTLKPLCARSAGAAAKRRPPLRQPLSRSSGHLAGPLKQLLPDSCSHARTRACSDPRNTETPAPGVIETSPKAAVRSAPAARQKHSSRKGAAAPQSYAQGLPPARWSDTTGWSSVGAAPSQLRATSAGSKSCRSPRSPSALAARPPRSRPIFYDRRTLTKGLQIAPCR